MKKAREEEWQELELPERIETENRVRTVADGWLLTMLALTQQGFHLSAGRWLYSELSFWIDNLPKVWSTDTIIGSVFIATKMMPEIGYTFAPRLQL